MSPSARPPEPAGFGNCPECAYAQGGATATCHACAFSEFEGLAPNRCDFCELPLTADGTCGNPVCRWDEDSRGFKWVWAMSMRTGALREAIDRYKVDGKQGWGWIFGRVLVGYLNANREIFERYHAIIPSPTYTGPGGRAFDHTGFIVERAMIEDDGHWPFELGLIEKTQATTRFRGQPWRSRFDIANTQLAPALNVARPEIVDGKRILVVDDVYTEGLTIRTVARALKAAGAVEVSEVVLARQPFGGSS